MCGWHDRVLDKVDAIAMDTGALNTVIRRYKYQGKYGWAIIFGRLLLGYLERTTTPDRVGLVMANPTWTDDGGLGHTERVIHEAARWDIAGRWPFDVELPAAAVLSQRPPSSAGKSGRKNLR